MLCGMRESATEGRRASKQRSRRNKRALYSTIQIAVPGQPPARSSNESFTLLFSLMWKYMCAQVRCGHRCHIREPTALILELEIVYCAMYS